MMEHKYLLIIDNIFINYFNKKNFNIIVFKIWVVIGMISGVIQIWLKLLLKINIVLEIIIIWR
jgi:hypothetical protein